MEGPFDYIKVRQQVNQPWRVAELTKGLTVTLTRNSLLFCCFASYMDWSRLLFPDGQLGPFLTGALCSNLAWLVSDCGWDGLLGCAPRFWAAHR